MKNLGYAYISVMWKHTYPINESRDTGLRIRIQPYLYCNSYRQTALFMVPIGTVYVLIKTIS